MNTKKFTGEEGRLISSAEASRLTGRFHEKQKKAGKQAGGYVEAQFYGNRQLRKLMDKDGCVGLRFYFGASEGGEPAEQIVVVAVNAEGRDLTSTRIGLKDMPNGEGDALADGPCCPHNCNP